MDAKYGLSSTESLDSGLVLLKSPRDLNTTYIVISYWTRRRRTWLVGLFLGAE